MALGQMRSEISSGVVIGPAIFGRDITVTLPRQVPPALAGLRCAARELVGRDDVLEELLESLDPATGRAGPGVVRVSAVAVWAG